MNWLAEFDTSDAERSLCSYCDGEGCKECGDTGYKQDHEFEVSED